MQNTDQARTVAASVGPDRRVFLVAGASASMAGVMPAFARAQAAASPFEAGLERAFEVAKPVALAGRVWKDGQTLWQGAKGLRRADGEAAVTQDDRWHLGSNGKAMTAALWARLVEQGKAAWDMPLPRAVEAAYPGMAIHAGWSDRSVDDFMRHRAGLYDDTYITPLWLMASRMKPQPLPVQRRELVQAVLAAPPNGPRGTYTYGNANYILVGALMEGLSGQPWEELMRSEVFAPLGMVTAGCGAPQGEQPWGHGAQLKPVNPESAGSDNPAVMGPAGTIHMGLADYGRFLNAMMTAGWLSQDSLSRLLTPLDGEQYALGWMAPGSRAWAGGPAVLHNGSNTMWFATVVMAPAKKLAFVSVANDAEHGGEACSALMSEMISAAAAS